MELNVLEDEYHIVLVLEILKLNDISKKKNDENHNNWRHWVEIGKMFVSYSEVFAEYSDNAKSVVREKVALEKFAPMTKPLRAKANHYRNN